MPDLSFRMMTMQVSANIQKTAGIGQNQYIRFTGQEIFYFITHNSF